MRDKLVGILFNFSKKPVEKNILDNISKFAILKIVNPTALSVRRDGGFYLL